MARLSGIALCICFISLTKSAWGIIGGRTAERYQFEYMVSFQTLPDRLHFCGGGLISESWIISASECFQQIKDVKKIVAIAGSLETFESIEYISQTRHLDEIVNHPNYTSPYNNIALIKTETPFEFGLGIKSIKLSQSFEQVGSALFAGWGQTSTVLSNKYRRLMYLEAPIIENEVCIGIFKETGLFSYNLRSSMLCTFPEKPRTGGCIGDQGGPLVKDGEIVGIMSLTNKKCIANEDIQTPIVFTKITNFLPFIQDTMSGGHDSTTAPNDGSRPTTGFVLFITYLVLLIGIMLV